MRRKACAAFGIFTLLVSNCVTTWGLWASTESCKEKDFGKCVWTITSMQAQCRFLFWLLKYQSTLLDFLLFLAPAQVYILTMCSWTMTQKLLQGTKCFPGQRTAPGFWAGAFTALSEGRTVLALQHRTDCHPAPTHQQLPSLSIPVD